jgi:methyltransferase-like protein/predicted O-methyltransferase YrrM
MQTATETNYDQVPYPSVPLRRTHPDQIASIAALFGLQSTPANVCRVLELGCADGANLIPMAASMPDSQFVGIDLSSAHIARGQSLVQQLGLTNLTLSHLSVMDVGPDFGVFDYIIAYGIFSWVTAEVQDKTLDICEHQLASNGVAFISYNTLPGWHMRGAIREMMLYHNRPSDDMKTRAERARALLTFLTESAPQVIGKVQENKAYTLILESEQERLAAQTDSYLLHELLEEYNQPFYFHQFMTAAERHGLQYLAEAELSTMMADTLPRHVAETIGRMGADVVAIEQYLDFLRNRMFRQTLLCRREVQVERTWGPELLLRFYIASPLKPVSASPAIQSASIEKFRSPNGTTISSGNPLNKAAFLYLNECWPLPIPYGKLLAEARSRCQTSAAPGDDARLLGDTLLKALAIDLIELQRNAPRFLIDISERPCASAHARLQAMRRESITNQRHEVVEVDYLMRAVIMHLDGQHDHAALLDVVSQRIGDTSIASSSTSTILESKLRDIARAALLVA